MCKSRDIQREINKVEITSTGFQEGRKNDFMKDHQASELGNL